MFFPHVCTKLSLLSTNFWDSPRIDIAVMIYLNDYCARHEKWQRFTVRKEEFTFQRPVFLAKLIPVKCRIPKGIRKLLIILDSSVGSAHF